ncbi:mediator of RNA polymerase II transcription subunit 7 [Sodiomyces alkalinus F11]|uniref:Mediator of RNA polymerase II transcription subunit 7 n=1 Tax=Sodiomyces alkalinus (strain CBS 110278 / VKM F-3762 / F11) TaxID=1314773 RepID=A0A3N2QAN7_SODAK|nr:mediator of RNA polymerase II transcription subunit 7 [Sodiomyces alkalinus F11]ROT43814.1 mediator of RNA polymerase II transcription subunit 7 [Sodiomyces alkalinus F11]
MADDAAGQQKTHASAFPDPPPFWKDFTPDNVAGLQQIRCERAAKDNIPERELPARLPHVPEHLINLQPPAEPPSRTWRVFGGQYSLDDKLPSLEEVNIQRLAATHNGEKDGKHLDRAFELKRMAKSLLLNFLELLGIMSIDPEDAISKVNDLRIILMNFHHVLNEYRPHQARESAIALMQSHLDRTRNETAAIRAQVDKAKRVLEGLGSLELPAIPDLRDYAAKEAAARKEEHLVHEADVWAAVDGALLS